MKKYEQYSTVRAGGSDVSFLQVLPAKYLVNFWINFNDARLQVWLLWREPASLQKHRSCWHTFTPAYKAQTGQLHLIMTLMVSQGITMPGIL